MDGEALTAAPAFHMPPPTPIASQIWDMKYRLKAPDGTPVDAAIEDTWRRVALALAAPERDPARHAPVFEAAMDALEFLPAGRILAGAGTARRVTLFNCFVMGGIPDDMSSIFAHLREAALTMQQGGGIGYDFSTLRPRGAPVVGVGADASGPLSFMDVWDAMCRTIMSAGHRRGAMMATLRCDHPDIEAFIEAKREAGRLRMFNLSVLVTDAFMAAVEADAPWPLMFGGKVWKTLQARALWDQIMRATYAYAEPGVIFIDRVNRLNNLHYCEEISASNPCGEQMLPPYGACLLGSTNLARLVTDPFTPSARLDLDRLDRLTRTAIRMLDNAIDISRFPLQQQQDEAIAKRRIGLGITGLADALIQCGERYGSDSAIALTERWLSAMQRSAYLASVELAREKGSFPLFDRDAYLAGETVRALDGDVREAIAAHGIRNALLTSIAPTGTISLLADNVSSGLEPVFSFTYTRTVLMPDGTKRAEEVSDYAYRLWRSLNVDAPLPDYFVTAQTLTPEDHARMQAACQRYIDNSISKTINVPADIDFGSFKEVYRRAYALGCKGCTTYRPNEVTGSVLSVAPASAPEPAPAGPPSKPGTRPQDLPGHTYAIRWPTGNIYLTVNDICDAAGQRRAYECFLNAKSALDEELTKAVTVLVSRMLQHATDLEEMLADLLQIGSDDGGHVYVEHEQRSRYFRSKTAAISFFLRHHIERLAAAAPGSAPALGPVAASGAALPSSGLTSCPSCGEKALLRSENCTRCTACSYSSC